MAIWGCALGYCWLQPVQAGEPVPAPLPPVTETDSQPTFTPGSTSTASLQGPLPWGAFELPPLPAKQAADRPDQRATEPTDQPLSTTASTGVATVAALPNLAERESPQPDSSQPDSSRAETGQAGSDPADPGQAEAIQVADRSAADSTILGPLGPVLPDSSLPDHEASESQPANAGPGETVVSETVVSETVVSEAVISEAVVSGDGDPQVAHPDGAATVASPWWGGWFQSPGEYVWLPSEDPLAPFDWDAWFAEREWLDFWTPNYFELGGSLTEGTRSAWTVTTKTNWVRESENWKHRVEIRGRYTEQESEVAANEWIGSHNLDYKSTKSPWLIFNKIRAEYDEIERLRVRATDSLGVGYRVWDDAPNKYLVFRIGPTVTYENYFSPTTQEWKPEFLGEGELKYTWKPVTFEHRTSVYPSLQGDQGIRLVNDTGILVPLDDDKLWSFKFGLLHTYNGTPNTNVQRNEFTATVALVFKR